MTSDPLAPSPTKSALLGFLSEVKPNQRYAIYPAGRYTSACLQGVSENLLESLGRKLVGFIDDNPETNRYHNRPKATLVQAVDSWSLDTILLLRDTHNGDLTKRIDALRTQGRQITVITQPTPTLNAMGAHLGSYSPSCQYTPEFIDACQLHESKSINRWQAQSTLLCTLDAEVFLGATENQISAYPQAIKDLCDALAEHGFSATLCVQLNDSPEHFLRTPDAVVETVIDAFGPDAIALHGYDHEMPVEGYTPDWFKKGLEELANRYGVTATYWAPPGWTLNWQTLATLQQFPQIKAVRGFATGVNARHKAIAETFRFPYQLGEIWQIPYSYADWMFLDYRCNELPIADIHPPHEQMARHAGSAPCLMETVAHPFRLTGVDSATRLKTVQKTLATYAKHGVRIAKVADAYQSMDAATPAIEECTL